MKITGAILLAAMVSALMFGKALAMLTYAIHLAVG